MASELDPTSKASDVHPSRRLKLTMPSAKGTQSYDTASAQHQAPASKVASHSPDRPSYSPVTPTLSQTSLALPQASQEHGSSQPRWMDQRPDPVPVNIEENPDAMAMSAAISILQMQRQQALNDMKDLNKMRKAALDDPQSFVDDLGSGKLAPAPRAGIDVDDEASDEGEADNRQGSDSKFGKFPAAQNVIRAPPIEWAKYHIVGEPLDRMHEVQRKYPGFKVEMLDAVQKPQAHTIASPYKAFADKLDDPNAPS